MNALIHNLITSTFHGSIIILAVVLLRVILRSASKKLVCLLWTLAFVRLLLPVEIPAPMSLQPVLPFSEIQWNPWIAKFLICIWLIAAVAFAVYSAVSYMNLKKQLHNAREIPGGWECDGIETAFVLGFINPKIYIPTHTPVDVRQHILNHERTHLEKGDLWFKMLGFIAVAIHWFNPLVWMAYLLYSKDLEMACDERVVQFMDLDERKAYSTALLNCASEETHLGVCPVAFGEVSVKDRIMFVLQYKQPTFRISFITVIAIAFVAGCLVTSSNTKFSAKNYGTEELAGKCISAVNELITAENFYLHHTKSEDWGSQIFENQGEYRKHGENYTYDSTDLTMSHMVFEGNAIMHYGDAWVINNDLYHADNMMFVLNQFMLENKNVNYTESIGAVDNYTASFDCAWEDQRYKGTITYHFTEKGSLTSVVMEYYDSGSNADVMETLTVMDEHSNDTYKRIQELAEQAITLEELEEIRRQAEIVTEVPSNKTSYDKNYFLGSGSGQWDFFHSESPYHVRLGAENASPTGLTMVHNEASDNHLSLIAEEGYWLEELVENKWVLVPALVENVEQPAQSIHVSWTTSDRYTIDWTNTYGALDGGFYRIGRYYTMTDANGKSETQVCYAKFRLFPPNFDQLLQKCNNAMSSLLDGNAPSVHFTTTNWCKQIREEPEYRELHGKEHYIVTEIWCSGNDRLSEQQYILKADNSLKDHSGLLYRNGTYYDLTWDDANAENAVTSWNTNTYADSFNFELALTNFTLWDGRIADILEDGNTITVILQMDWEELNFQYPAHYEVVFTFDDSGKLTNIKEFAVYGENGDDYELQAELVVHDYSEQDIANLINRQNVTTPNSFSWEEDSAAFEENSMSIRRKNFVNTTAQTVNSPADAVEIARKDCTLPASGGIEPGTNMSKAYYDTAAKMWKVEFTASWDDSIYQAVYLNDKGITQITVQKTGNY